MSSLHKTQSEEELWQWVFKTCHMVNTQPRIFKQMHQSIMWWAEAQAQMN